MKVQQQFDPNLLIFDQNSFFYIMCPVKSQTQICLFKIVTNITIPVFLAIFKRWTYWDKKTSDFNHCTINAYYFNIINSTYLTIPTTSLLLKFETKNGGFWQSQQLSITWGIFDHFSWAVSLFGLQNDMWTHPLN